MSDTENPLHHPRRGSDVEAWLMRQRDAWVVAKVSDHGKPYLARQANWWALNEAVRDYQRRADAGLSLMADDESNGAT
jgi:hypothetical protein